MLSESKSPSAQDLVRQGRREGYALAALVLSLVSYVNLLGMEKSILAIVLAVFAVKGVTAGVARKNGLIAIAIAALHILTVIIVLVLLRDKLAQLMELLEHLKQLG